MKKIAATFRWGWNLEKQSFDRRLEIQIIQVLFTQENLSLVFANSKGASAQTCCTSAFRIRLLECIISKLATSEISRYSILSM